LKSAGGERTPAHDELMLARRIKFCDTAQRGKPQPKTVLILVLGLLDYENEEEEEDD
jgi:hypothetical protein